MEKRMENLLNRRFPSSTCDSSLDRPYLPREKKNLRLWSSKAWTSQLTFFTNFLSDLRSSELLHNQSRILCLCAGAGHDVMSLQQMGVEDVIGVELVESPPLVKKVDPMNLPFFDDVFDIAFTARLAEDESLLCASVSAGEFDLQRKRSRR
ncbi:hypothetical protein LINGRAHAP2_LOCUS29258 [Linum grandiflorum]